MFVITRKKIFYWILLLGIIFYIIYYFTNIFFLNSDIKDVVSVINNERVVIIDAGHGGEDGGAVSATGISEADINLAIALDLQELLEQTGITVILTRSTDEAIYDTDKSGSIKEKKVSDLKNRVKIGNESSADLFVSIHLNKISQTQYDGWQTFYKENDEKGKNIAELIQENLNSTISLENKRLPKTIENIYLVENVTIPITIVECGFLSNQQELSLLITKEYQQKLAWGIYSGIIEWFGDN
jgi:N-acetylmuramoyl-L-alanine amidase